MSAWATTQEARLRVDRDEVVRARPSGWRRSNRPGMGKAEGEGNDEDDIQENVPTTTSVNFS